MVVIVWLMLHLALFNSVIRNFNVFATNVVNTAFCPYFPTLEALSSNNYFSFYVVSCLTP